MSWLRTIFRHPLASVVSTDLRSWATGRRWRLKEKAPWLDWAKPERYWAPRGSGQVVPGSHGARGLTFA